jgi:hypothetical protein
MLGRKRNAKASEFIFNKGVIEPNIMSYEDAVLHYLCQFMSNVLKGWRSGELIFGNTGVVFDERRNIGFGIYE